MDKLLSTFYKICEPSLTVFPNELDRRLQYMRNQKFLVVQIAIFLLLSLHTLFIQENPGPADYWYLLIFSTNITVFCFLCRSWPCLFKVFYVIIMAISGPVAVYIDKDGVFACWAAVYLAPVLMLYYTECNISYLFEVGIQLLLLIFCYKDKTIEALNVRTSEAFIKEMMAVVMFATVFNSLIIHNLGTSLVTTFKQEIILGEKQRKELEVQKTFVLSFSHEIRNLINTLTGNIQLSLLEKVCPTVKGYLEDAEVGAGLLIQLINNILDSGNLDVGELDINHSNQMIHCTLQRTWRMCAYMLKAKGLRGQFRIMKSLPRNIKIDHERFMQILVNLIVNAVKFTDKGSVDVELEWIPHTTQVTEASFYPSPFDDENEGVFEKDKAISILTDNFTIIGLDKKKWCCRGYNSLPETGSGILKLVVTDTGYGVTPKNISHVFDRFSSQVFGDENSNKLGTTIGLYVTKELCHRMGGDIKIFSKVDRGTSFIVCIPAERVIPENQIQRSSSLASTAATEERKLKAMIVDDLNFNIVVLTNYLQRMKIEVVNTAVDGLDAFNKYVESVRAGNKFDIVTMDVEMPVMDGKEAVRKIREFERENNLSPCFVIMVSGNVTESEISQCLKHNGNVMANNFLKKPAVFDDVSRVITEHFSFGSQSSIPSFD